MVWLDCHDVGSTLASIAGAVAISPTELEQALREYDDEARFNDCSEDPWKLMPCEVLAWFDTDIETIAASFGGAHYFHGTRALDSDAFRRRGILPLDQMVEELWATLREFAGDEMTDEHWATFRSVVEQGAGGHDGFLYRLKTGGRTHFGPFGLLVREIFLDPQATGSHDYLGCPEIVQDIARCYRVAHVTDLEQRFCDTARPCIVNFRSSQLRRGAINAALWFAYTKLRDDEITGNANWAFDGEGEPVPAEDVLDVEVVV